MSCVIGINPLWYSGRNRVKIFTIGGFCPAVINVSFSLSKSLSSKDFGVQAVELIRIDHCNHLQGRRHLMIEFWVKVLFFILSLTGMSCHESLLWFHHQSLKLSRFIQLLDRYVRFWTRCWSTMGSYVVLCGEYNIARDILSWSVSFFFPLTHYSSRLAGMIYKMDPFLMPRPFCIGLSCDREVSILG